MDPMDASAVRGKITLVRFCSNLQLPGSDEELTAVTFCIMDEDHTMGNALRYMLMKDPRVEFCGYTYVRSLTPDFLTRQKTRSISVCKCRNRLTTEHTVSAVDALRDALEQLDHVFSTIEERYLESKSAGHVNKEPAPPPCVPLRTPFSA